MAKLKTYQYQDKVDGALGCVREAQPLLAELQAICRDLVDKPGSEARADNDHRCALFLVARLQSEIQNLKAYLTEAEELSSRES
jgi:hypothetical protein